jgi:hypothetical protein
VLLDLVRPCLAIAGGVALLGSVALQRRLLLPSELGGAREAQARPRPSFGRAAHKRAHLAGAAQPRRLVLELAAVGLVVGTLQRRPCSTSRRLGRAQSAWWR